MDTYLTFLVVGCSMSVAIFAADIGGSCKQDNDCMVPNSVCVNIGQCQTGECKCRADHVQYSNGNRSSCVESVFGKTCTTDEECYGAANGITTSVKCSPLFRQPLKRCLCADGYKVRDRKACVIPQPGQCCDELVGCKADVFDKSTLSPTCQFWEGDCVCPVDSAETRVTYLGQELIMCLKMGPFNKEIGQSCSFTNECKSRICRRNPCAPDSTEKRCQPADGTKSGGITASASLALIATAVASVTWWSQLEVTP